MEKRQFISELVPGESADGLFLINLAQQNQARNGPYWRVVFKDSSGSIEGKIWSPLAQQVPELKAGNICEVQGRVVVYREKNEIAVDALRVLSEEEAGCINLGDFMPASSRDSESMLQELEALCRANFSHGPWKKFYKLILKDDEINSRLRIAPAAKAMHHAYAGGLLEHTLGVARAAMALADLYPSLDRQVLLAGAICHDLGKMWELSSGLVIDYTTQGRMIGHISIMLEILEPFLKKSGLEPELAEHLKHLVLSHHGSREFGSPCLPATAEAQVLHFADNIDAKINQFNAALGAVPDGEEGWSSFVPGLDRHLYQARQSPEGGKSKKSGDKTRQEESQCSLLLKE